MNAFYLLVYLETQASSNPHQKLETSLQQVSIELLYTLNELYPFKVNISMNFCKTYVYKTTTIMRYRTFPSTPKGSLCPIAVHLSFHPQSQAPLMCFLSQKINLHFCIRLCFLEFDITVIIQYNFLSSSHHSS